MPRGWDKEKRSDVEQETRTTPFHIDRSGGLESGNLKSGNLKSGGQKSEPSILDLRSYIPAGSLASGGQKSGV